MNRRPAGVKAVCILFLGLGCAIPYAVQAADGGRLDLYVDATLSHCMLADAAPQVADVYFVHKVAGSWAEANGVIGILYFRLESSVGFTGTWLEDVLPAGMGSAGTSQSGISIGYDACYHTQAMVLRVRYQMHGTSSPCSSLEVVPSLNSCCIVTSTCFWGDEPPVDGGHLVVNGNQSCPCDIPVSIESSTWSRIKAMYRN